MRVSAAANCPLVEKLQSLPILKKPNGERSTDNLRPISLQSGLAKIVTKVLATRLADIFSRHAALHPAQEAFLRGCSAFKCVDVCLDVWEHAKQNKRSCVNVFYDIRAAYDSVRHADLLRALQRLRLPAEFIEFVGSCLSPQFVCPHSIWQLYLVPCYSLCPSRGSPRTYLVHLLHGPMALWSRGQPVMRQCSRRF